MIRVTIRRQGSARDEVHGFERPLLTLGRDEDNLVVLADKLVSSVYAFVFKNEEGIVLVDINSTNRTFVNGKLVRRRVVLSPQDTVEIGSFTLRFEHVDDFEDGARSETTRGHRAEGSEREPLEFDERLGKHENRARLRLWAEDSESESLEFDERLSKHENRARHRLLATGLARGRSEPTRGRARAPTSASGTAPRLPRPMAGQDLKSPSVTAPSGPIEERPPKPVPSPDGLFSSSETEARVLEVALARELVADGRYPLYVLVRLHETTGLLARLLGRWPEEQHQLEGSGSRMMVDFPVGPDGDPVPLSLRVTVKSGDFELDVTSKRVRLYYGHDTPLLTFFVWPRTTGTVSLVIEVQIEDDLVGSEQIWRICIERSVARSDADAPVICQSSPFHSRLKRAWLEPQPERSSEYRLHTLLVQLFTADELYRWVRLNFESWSDHIPRTKASANEVAFAVVDSGLRSGYIDTKFFDLLKLQFPRWSVEISQVRSAFTDPASAGW